VAAAFFSGDGVVVFLSGLSASLNLRVVGRTWDAGALLLERGGRAGPQKTSSLHCCDGCVPLQRGTKTYVREDSKKYNIKMSIPHSMEHDKRESQMVVMGSADRPGEIESIVRLQANGWAVIHI
jgi:hypothetical protein